MNVFDKTRSERRDKDEESRRRWFEERKGRKIGGKEDGALSIRRERNE